MNSTLKLPCVLPISAAESYVAHASFEEVLIALPDESVDAIYSDPPFNTGVTRVDPRDRATLYQDSFAIEEWLSTLRAFASGARRVLKPTGSIFLHLDWRGVHEAKVFVMDQIFGRDAYVGEIVWSYDWGARQRDRFALKHDTILHYAASPGNHRFDASRVDTVPYKAPELQHYRAKRLGKTDGAARIARGKPITDVFQDINIVGTSSHERSDNSYPTMKPVKLLRRLLAPVVQGGDRVIDPFCGSGPIVDAAAALGCSFVASDISARAFEVTKARAKRANVNFDVVER
jgi:site-specific DNA-methyltransferase (adenine-specific)